MGVILLTPLVKNVDIFDVKQGQKKQILSLVSRRAVKRAKKLNVVVEKHTQRVNKNKMYLFQMSKNREAKCTALV